MQEILGGVLVAGEAARKGPERLVVEVVSLADGGAISPAQARDQGEKAAGSGAEAKGNKAERAAAVIRASRGKARGQKDA